MTKVADGGFQGRTSQALRLGHVNSPKAREGFTLLGLLGMLEGPAGEVTALTRTTDWCAPVFGTDCILLTS